MWVSAHHTWAGAWVVDRVLGAIFWERGGQPFGFWGFGSVFWMIADEREGTALPDDHGLLTGHTREGYSAKTWGRVTIGWHGLPRAITADHVAITDDHVAITFWPRNL